MSRHAQPWRAAVARGQSAGAAALAVLVLGGGVGCNTSPGRIPAGQAARSTVAKSDPARPQASQPEVPRRAPATAQVIAIGDVHGDLNALRGALRLAGVIDESDRWTGGTTVVVQTGDQLDRGDDEQAILDMITRLQQEASRAGGGFVALNGNHELMNAWGDLRYVTPGGFSDFDEFASDVGAGTRAADVPAQARGRVVAFTPGGPYAQVLAQRDVIAIVGDTVFVHGGVRPPHVRYGVDRLNAESRAWLAGEGELPALLQDPEGPVWTRIYSDDAQGPDCAQLTETLTALGVARMVVGHTVQPQGINAACDEKVWRIDVGLAAHYGGPMQVLKIEGDHVSILRRGAHAGANP